MMMLMRQPSPARARRSATGSQGCVSVRGRLNNAAVALGSPQRTPAFLKDALRESEEQIIQAVEGSAEELGYSSQLLNDLERAIEDVHDLEVYWQPRQLLADLDRERAELRWRATHIDIHRKFDPIRIALRDIEAGYR